MTTSVKRTAVVSVFGKGYTVTQPTEEFQRLVPIRLDVGVSSVEQRLADCEWGGVLEPLYALSDTEIAATHCTLVSARDAVVVTAGKTTDRLSRPSLVLVGACAPIDWRDPDGVADTVSRLRSLSGRLVSAYSGVMARGRREVQEQLSVGRFLPSREFDLDEEGLDESVPWQQCLRAVSRWKGIHGVATRHLVGVGANVLLGTASEADVLLKTRPVDGYFDLHRRVIVPLGDRLKEWHAQPAVPPVTTAVDVPDNRAVAGDALVNAKLAEIAQSVRGLESQAVTFVELFGQFMRIMLGGGGHDDRDRDRKKRR